MVFLYDILVFSKSLEDHVSYLRLVLIVLLDNQLYAKQSKCVFSYGEMEYLGHLISGQGLELTPRKYKLFKTGLFLLREALSGFLGLIGYYRKFIKDYGLIAAP